MNARTALIVVALAATGAAVGGCGSSSSTDSSSASASAGGISATAVFAAAKQQFLEAKSVSISLNATKDGKPAKFVIGLQLPGRVGFTASVGTQAVDMRLLGAKIYIRANRTFWDTTGSSQTAARLLTDRWVEAQTSDIPGLGGLRTLVDRHTLASCFAFGKPGSLSDDGTGQWDGTPVDIIRDDKTGPGDGVNRLYISSSFPHRLLHAVQLSTNPGKQKSSKSCLGSGSGSSSGGGKSSLFSIPSSTHPALSLSGYNATTVAAPPSALNLTKLLAAQQA